MGFLVDEHVVLHAGGGVAVELDDGTLPMYWPGGALFSSAGKCVERRTACRTRCTRRRRVNTSSQRSFSFRADERHVARRELLDLEQVGHLLLVHSRSSSIADQVTRPPLTPMICPVT